jgi:hypothetical protein
MGQEKAGAGWSDHHAAIMRIPAVPPLGGSSLRSRLDERTAHAGRGGEDQIVIRRDGLVGLDSAVHNLFNTAATLSKSPRQFGARATVGQAKQDQLGHCAAVTDGLM